jgi:diguanylate cyclase (GGDEF)-like protein
MENTLLHADALQKLRAFLRSFRDERFRDVRHRDFARFSAIASLITALFILSTIAWDFSIDPANAHLAVNVRLTQALAVALMGLVFWLSPGSIWSYVAFLLVPLYVELSFIEVVTRLENGQALAIGGFLYFFIFVPFIGRSLDLFYNIFVLTVLAIAPTILHSGGYADAINIDVYHAYVWMVFGPIVLIMIATEFLHWHMDLYRQELAHRAYHDELTGLPNRRHFMELAGKLHALAPRQNTPVSVMYMDIDNFKRINDDYGHTAGDHAIQMLARTIESALRRSDVIARYGGEEFVAWLHGADAEQALHVAERIRETVRNTALQLDQESDAVHCTISIGIATESSPSLDEDSDLGDMLREADKALYEAKHSGKDRITCKKM